MNEIEFIVDTYGDMLLRICYLQLHSVQDAEDALQDTYLRYIRKAPSFKCEEHRKAWLIRVAVNICRDIMRKSKRHLTENIDDLPATAALPENEEGEVLSTLMKLPEKYSSVMLLHFSEGYNYKTIAKMIGKSESAVKMRIKKGREMFIKIYKEDKL